MLASLGKGFDLIRRDSRIAALGMGQSCFEGAMYTFVFMWTPALKSDAEKSAENAGLYIHTYILLLFCFVLNICKNELSNVFTKIFFLFSILLGGESNVVTTSSYLGLIFAVFMVCVMVGSSFFKLLSTNKDDLYRIPLYLHSIAFFAMGSVTLFLENKAVVYTSFLIFEVSSQ